MSRYCAACGLLCSKDSYSKNQWSKGDGVSRCASCVGGYQSSSSFSQVDPRQTARRNNAHRATFTEDALNHPFAQGAFRWVAKGKYTEGDRKGQACVCKWFKTGVVFEEHFCDVDMEASQMAVVLISRWNSERFIDRMVKVNLPEVWTFEVGSSRSHQKVLQEPFIANYQKFNSNTGWSEDDFPWGRAMQALSHFTYHISNGQMLVCDLQGGVYSDGVVLTDPVVMSDSRSYGPTDLGLAGIKSFFYYHSCNEYCRSHWRTPRVGAPTYQRTAGTTMEHVPTRSSRPNMTFAAHHGYR